MFIEFAHAAAETAAKPPMIMQLVPYIAIFAIFYFLMIRPQAKRQKKHQELLKSLKRGDEVLTSNGILGTVEGITDNWVTLEIAEDVRIKILRTQIASSAKEVTEG